MHRPPFVRLPLTQHGPTSSAPCKGKKVGLVSFSLHVWERDEHQGDKQRAEAIHWCHPEPSLLYLLKEWPNRAGWSKKENPCQIIIHGKGIFLSGLLYRSLSQHITLSISPDKCQSKGLSPGFFRVGGQLGEALEDFRDNSQWVHSDGGLATMVTWLHCQCVVL